MTVRTVLRRTAWLLVPGALVGACSSQPAAPAATPAPSAAADTKAPEPLAEQALLEDLVLANRILTREAGILDIQAHVSVRSKANPNHWYMARFVAPGGASLSDMVEYDFESNPVKGPRNDNARETFLHRSEEHTSELQSH